MKAYDNCPKCHDRIEFGYGLAFGGFGAYQYCENQACDWYEKDRECPTCEEIEPCGCSLPAPEPQPAEKGDEGE